MEIIVVYIVTQAEEAGEPLGEDAEANLRTELKEWFDTMSKGTVAGASLAEFIEGISGLIGF